MQSTRRPTVVLAFVLLAVSTLLPAVAGARPHGPFPGRGPMLERMVERLDLSSEQEEAIRGILDSHREEMRQQAAAIWDARAALRAQIHAEPFDEGAIRQAWAAVADVEEEAAVARGLLFHEVSQILTPEQRTEARRLAAEAGERFRAHRRHRHFAPAD